MREAGQLILRARAAVRGEPVFDTARLLALAKARAPDPAIFDERDPFFWRVNASNNLIDFYFTRMADRTLQNFARALKDGVSFQDSHNTRKLGLGQSLDGAFIREEATHDDGIQKARAAGDFFTLPGINLNGVNTDDFIAGVRGGVLRDVSVGFWADDITCSICGGQMYHGWFGTFGRECEHVAGLSYETKDAKDVLCYAWINDGELSEVSQVYDGATPEANVAKAETLAREGKLSLADRARLEGLYRIRLPERPGSWTDATWVATGDTSTRAGRGGQIMTAERPQAATTANDNALGADEQVALLRQRLLDHELDPGLAHQPVAAALALATELGETKHRLAELAPLADAGRAYRADLIEAALTEGVRAMGNAFARATYEQLLTGLDTENIKRLRDDWQALAARVLASPAVATTDSELDQDERTPTPLHLRTNHAAAYKA